VRFDQWLLEKMSALRKCRLPNETGGILVGHFDTYQRVCSIVDVLPSPPDSTEWPTSYIRGFAGLRQQLQDIETVTHAQLGYVGEWHSHPRGASVLPSTDDFKAYGWLGSQMLAESLPAIMVIIGDSKRYCLVGAPSP
jgi:proteasome lid subunit RPN8/RPN11